MEQEILKLAMSQGIFALLFVWLLFTVMKYNREREERLMACLEKLTLDVAEIKNDVEDMKGRLEKLC